MLAYTALCNGACMAHEPSLLASAIVYELRKQFGQVPWWPSSLIAVTGLEDPSKEPAFQMCINALQQALGQHTSKPPTSTTGASSSSAGVYSSSRGGGGGAAGSSTGSVAHSSSDPAAAVVMLGGAPGGVGPLLQASSSSVLSPPDSMTSLHPFDMKCPSPQPGMGSAIRSLSINSMGRMGTSMPGAGSGLLSSSSFGSGGFGGLMSSATSGGNLAAAVAAAEAEVAMAAAAQSPHSLLSLLQ